MYPQNGNPSAMFWQTVRSRRGRFIVPAYTYSPRIRKPFRMHSRNVRNVFVICVLHIRRVKVWFLRCKSMVFGVQKGGFYIAKVWFLFFECWVVAICLECYGNLSATFWQSVRSCRVRFIVPAYTNISTKWGTKIRVR